MLLLNPWLAQSSQHVILQDCLNIPCPMLHCQGVGSVSIYIPLGYICSTSKQLMDTVGVLVDGGKHGGGAAVLILTVHLRTIPEQQHDELMAPTAGSKMERSLHLLPSSVHTCPMVDQHLHCRSLPIGSCP